MNLVDLTDRSPASYRLRTRKLSEIRAVILHQTGFEWRESNPSWVKVRAHFVVHRSGRVSQLHPITARMLRGSGHANAWAVSIEHEGNYPLLYRGDEPVYWKPEKFGRSVLADAPEQIQAARDLLVYLNEQVPGIQVGTHRQLDKGKSGCAGPDLWREVGQYGVDVLGMPEMPTNRGRDIPADWRLPR